MILISLLRAIKHFRLCKCSDNTEIDLLNVDFLDFDPNLLNQMLSEDSRVMPTNSEAVENQVNDIDGNNEPFDAIPTFSEAVEEQAKDLNENNESFDTNILNDEINDFFKWIEKNENLFSDPVIQENTARASVSSEEKLVYDVDTFAQYNTASEPEIPESSEPMVENSPPHKRTRIDFDLSGTSAIDSNANSNVAANFLELPINGFEINESTFSMIENHSTAVLNEVKNKQVDEQMINSIDNLFNRAILINNKLKNCKEIFKFSLNFIEKQRNLERSSSSPSDCSLSFSNLTNLLKVESQKYTSKKSVNELSQDFLFFILDLKKCFLDFNEILIPTNILIECCETIESYLKAMLNYENILISDNYIIYKYFFNQYQTKTYKLDEKVGKNSKIFSACRNSNYIYVVHKNNRSSQQCFIIKFCMKEGYEQAKTYFSYISKKSEQRKLFGKSFKRILTDSENKVYILNAERNPEILVLNSEFEEIRSITVRFIESNSGIVNACIADFCMRENRLYILDNENLFIYCYDLDLKFLEKIKINDVSLKGNEAFLSISQNYIFIVYKNSLLVLDLKTHFLKKFENLLTFQAYNFSSSNDQCFIAKCLKYFYVYIYDIKNEENNIILENLKVIQMFAYELQTAITSEIISSCDDEIAFISLNTDEATIIKVKRQ